MITADGYEDAKIQPEGPTGHIVPGPLPSAVSVAGPVPCEISEPATISADDEMKWNEGSEPNEDVGSAQGDDILEVCEEIDRNLDHEFVGQTFNVRYDHGWLTGVAA